MFGNRERDKKIEDLEQDLKMMRGSIELLRSQKEPTLIIPDESNLFGIQEVRLSSAVQAILDHLKLDLVSRPESVVCEKRK